jgi:hypothetical protein
MSRLVAMNIPIPPPDDFDEGEDDLAPASGDYDMRTVPDGGADKMSGSVGSVKE